MTTEVIPRQKNYSYLLAALVGVLIFELSIGPHVLSPRWASWLYASIREQYESAWLAYRHAPWSFPIGKLPLFFYPHGSSIAFMDGAPWYLTILKLLNPILPKDFAAWGWWLLICCIFQAVSARRLMNVLSQSESVRWIGTLLLTCSPVFIQRSSHFALMAQGFVLLAWSLFFEEKNSSKNRWHWLAMLTVVAGIHPYLTVMVFTIRSTALVFSTAPVKERILDLLLSIAAIISVFLIFGYFQNGSTTDVGADFFSTDIAAFFLSFGTGTLIPSIAAHPGEQEGYAYLGAGIIFLVFATLGLLFLRKEHLINDKYPPEEKWLIHRAVQGFIIGAILFVFSFGTHLRIFGFELAATLKTSNPMYMLFFGKLKELPLIFRAPGRFSWPLYYLIAAFSVRALSRRMAILYIAVLLQFLDVGPYITNPHLRLSSAAPPPALKNKLVDERFHAANEIIFIPLEPRESCGMEPNAEAYRLMKGVLPIAAENNIPFNSGLQARTPEVALHQLCKDEIEDFKGGKIKIGAVYVVDTQYLTPNLTDPETGLLTCTHFTSISVCLGETPYHRHSHHAHLQNHLHKTGTLKT